MDRKVFKWKAQLQRDDGQILDIPFACYWDPAADDAAEAVARSAAAMAFVTGGKQHTYAGVSAVRA